MPGVLMEGIRKYYGVSCVLANDGAELSVRDGEIHAVVGENGAGKSTLMKILYGLERPDAGRILLDGREVSPSGPAEAASLGIGMVQQHAELVEELTVADNVALRAEPRRFGFLYDRRAAREKVAALAAANGFALDPSAPASSLSVAQRQELEILRLLWREAGVLILDEPTAALADEEVESLFSTLRRLSASGRTVIMITHKVREVLAIADSVTIMRKGRSVARLDLRSRAMGEEELAALMMEGSSVPALARDAIGARVEAGHAPPPAGGGATRSGAIGNAPVFEMFGVSWARRGASRKAVDGLSLSVSRGEIFGVCALAGNGLAELEDLATGFLRPSSGAVLLNGFPLPKLRGPSLGYVPQDRMRRGASLHAAVDENLVALDRDAFFPKGIRDRAAIAAFSAKAIESFDIAGSAGQRLGSLSGGNIQKVVLARELSGKAGFIVFANPTWGLDIAATAFVHERILDARSRGVAILLLSPNLDEVLSLSDRIAAMSRGRIVFEGVNDGGLDPALIGRAMLGAVGRVS